MTASFPTAANQFSALGKHKILVIDYGSQYTQLIARRVRELGVYCVLLPHTASAAEIKNIAPNGVILSGGPLSVANNAISTAATIKTAILELKVPLLGICYGMQLMAEHFGGAVKTTANKEFGKAILTSVASESLLLANITPTADLGAVWMSHQDQVQSLPQGFITTATTADTPIAAMENASANYYAVQFHPEVTHTAAGKQLLGNFVHTICGCDNSWNVESIIDNELANIARQVGDEVVVLGLSGGVDSSVVAALCQRAIGAQLVCVFVDTGLLRLDEGDQVMRMFADNMGIKVIRVNAEQQFLDALENVSDPEQKRKIIGNLFVRIFEREAKKLTNAKWLAQGTIYPDVIESAGAGANQAHLIKSHHNVGGLPSDMQLKLLEPLRRLFKDEVRNMGEKLGLPKKMLHRHPFPGPGLGVRIVGAVNKKYADILRLADDIFISELYAHDLYYQTSQAFAVFLPLKSVGVKGDGRSYDYVIALRAVTTIDFMTAKAAKLDSEFLDMVATRIINEVDGVSRVVYDISSKPPATIEWE